MSNKTRKGVRPGMLATALGVVAMLAVLAALALPSSPAHAQANPFAPNAPTAVTAAANDDGTQVMVTWTAATGGGPASGYEVERKVGDGNWMSADPAHTGTMASYTDDSVSDGMTYTYRVRATNNFGQSVWVESNAVTVTVPVADNEPPVLTGTPLPGVPSTGLSLRIPEQSSSIDASVAFSDPDEGDVLTYSSMSNNTNVATVSTDPDSGATIVSTGTLRGEATITITATDGDGATVSITFMVRVSEGYTITAVPMAVRA